LPAPCNAINLAPNEAGEVLIFPYYTVRNGFDTLISVTNISDRTVLAALRVREARNGRPLREFHLALAAYDVWTGAVTSDGGGGAVVRSFDRSCTAPALEAGPNGSTQIALSTAGFDGSDARYPYDNGGRDLSRVQEGFVEVIQMAISSYPTPGHQPDSSIDSSIQYRTSIDFRTVNGVHVPRDCPGYQALMAYPANFDPISGLADATLPTFSSFEAPKNVLFGSATLINVGSGQAYDATPTTIQNFRATAPIIYMPGSGKPTLAHGDAGMTAIQFDRDGNLISTPNIASSVDAVSTVLMATQLTNEFATGGTATSGARTDWVVTYPTKHFYTDAASSGSSVALAPFGSGLEFLIQGSSCNGYNVLFADRTGDISIDEIGFIPPSFFRVTCRSANALPVLQVRDQFSSILASGDESALAMPQSGRASFASGWLTLYFRGYGFRSQQADPRELPGGYSLNGLLGVPAIGFAVIERNNSAEAGNNRNYGSGRPHVVDVIKP
jgi:hypothetical protein